MIENIKDAFNCYYDEKVINVEKTKGSQNNVYLITTDTTKYIVKQFTNMNSETLKERKEQLRISKIWNDNGISCVQPLTDIFEYKDNYYIIYPYIEGLNAKEGELSLDKIKKLARVQARMHLLQIDTWLPCHIRHIDYKDPRIQNVIDICNESVEVAKKEMCVCDNDFKPTNMVWNNDEALIIDFDAVYKNHPTFSLIESAYTFCHNGDKLNLKYYREYISEYKKEYNKELNDIDIAIYGAWNGKIQWIQFLSNNRPDDQGITNLTNQIIKYQEYVADIKNILKELFRN